MWQVDSRATDILVWTARGAYDAGELGRTEQDSTGKSAYTWNHPARLAYSRARLKYNLLFISNSCNVCARVESRRARSHVVALEGTRSICLWTSLRVRMSHLGSVRKNVPSRFKMKIRSIRDVMSLRAEPRWENLTRRAEMGRSYAPSRDRTFLSTKLRWDVFAPTRRCKKVHAK